MRTAGNYKSAFHKFKEALNLDPENKAAKFELEMLHRIVQLDSQISLDKIESLKKLRPIYDDNGIPVGDGEVIDFSREIKFKKSDKMDCGEIDESICNIF